MSQNDVVNAAVHKIFYKILLSFIVIIICAASAQPEARVKKKRVAQNYDITASAKYASLVVNSDTGQVLHKQDANKPLHPASLTKMMTIYKAFEAIRDRKISLNTKLPVSKWASSQQPTKLHLKPGQSITLRDALYGMIIHSANDASVVVAEALAGSEDAFAVQMTRTAHQLGMKDTTFKNAHGLHHPQQITTAFDMAKLGIALRRDFPQYYPMFSKKSFIFNGAVINGHNRVMSRYRWADGLKTGFTNPSGFNLVTSASRPEGRIVAVVMGGYSAAARDNHMISLLDKGFTTLTNGKYVPDNRNYTSAQETHDVSDSPFDVASLEDDVMYGNTEEGSTSAFASMEDLADPANATLDSLSTLSNARLLASDTPVSKNSKQAISSKKRNTTNIASKPQTKVRMQASAPKIKARDLKKARDEKQMSKAAKAKRDADQRKKAQLIKSKQLKVDTKKKSGTKKRL